MTKRSKTVPGTSSVIEHLKTTGIVEATEKAIAIVAYQFWLDSGCPSGSDQEHWFRAEAILRQAIDAMFDELSTRSWTRECDTLGDSEMVGECTWERWDGHWEVWEREWGSARWVWETGDPGVQVSNRAA